MKSFDEVYGDSSYLPTKEEAKILAIQGRGDANGPYLNASGKYSKIQQELAIALMNKLDAIVAGLDVDADYVSDFERERKEQKESIYGPSESKHSKSGDVLKYSEDPKESNPINDYVPDDPAGLPSGLIDRMRV